MRRILKKRIKSDGSDRYEDGPDGLSIGLVDEKLVQ